MRKTKPMTISFPKELAKQVDELAEERNMTRSELLRASFRNYLKEEISEQKLMSSMSKKAKEMGIEDLDDLEKLIDEVRK